MRLRCRVRSVCASRCKCSRNCAARTLLRTVRCCRTMSRARAASSPAPRKRRCLARSPGRPAALRRCALSICARPLAGRRSRRRPRPRWPPCWPWPLCLIPSRCLRCPTPAAVPCWWWGHHRRRWTGASASPVTTVSWMSRCCCWMRPTRRRQPVAACRRNATIRCGRRSAIAFHSVAGWARSSWAGRRAMPSIWNCARAAMPVFAPVPKAPSVSTIRSTPHCASRIALA